MHPKGKGGGRRLSLGSTSNVICSASCPLWRLHFWSTSVWASSSPSRAALEEELWKLFISAEWRASKADDVTAARRRQEGGEQLWGSRVGLFVLIFTPFKLGNGARQLDFGMCFPYISSDTFSCACYDAGQR